MFYEYHLVPVATRRSVTAKQKRAGSKDEITLNLSLTLSVASSLR